MDLKEYIKSFTNDVQTDADAFQISLEEAFLVNIADRLVENETITDYTPGYFKKMGRQNKRIEINGFSFDEADGSYNLFVVDDLYDYNSLLTNTRLDTLIKKAEELVYCSIEYKFLDWEESSAGYEVASHIYRLFNNLKNTEIDYDLKKIRIYVLTNKSLNLKMKKIKRPKIHGIPVEFSVYDATKLYEMAKAGFEKESIDIKLSDYGLDGINAIKCTSREGEFESYLTSMPGDVLADIYLEHGSQILEGNVRSFLSVRGKVNKGIRKTILSEPDKFFILNNGITVTSSSIDIEDNDRAILIKSIKDLQIVNGGQTTASLANAAIKDKADLSSVQVMMKLSVLNDSNISERLVPEISRASNSQNKVDEADFFSNHPFHIKIEDLSKRILAPAVDGQQYQTAWFYERARGQYTVAQMKMTPAQAKAFQLKNPKNQVIKKTDMAKYSMIYEGYPHEASKGAQFVMKRFSELIQGTDGDGGLWANDSSQVNETYFKNLIAKAIMFKETEKLVSGLNWYKEIKAYRANIVAYSIAVLSNEASKRKKQLDLNKIWNTQHLFTELVDQLKITSKEVYDFLTGPRETQNVTEWAKKEKCWVNAKKCSWTLSDDFLKSLIVENSEKKNGITEAVVDSMKFVTERGPEFWQPLINWGKKYLYITPQEEGILKSAIKIHTEGKIPTERQFKAIVQIYNSLVRKGYDSQAI